MPNPACLDESFENTAESNLQNMPVIYTIDAKERLIRTRCIGNVTFAEVLAHFRELERDPNTADPLDVLLDLSETSSLPASGEITAVAGEIKRIRQRVRFNACAVVAQRDALYGMLRMFEVVAEPYFRAIRVFRLSVEAEAWLASQRLPINIPTESTPVNNPSEQSGGNDPTQ